MPWQPPSRFGEIDEEAVGVDRPPGADQPVPPAAPRRVAVMPGGVRVAGQRVVDEDRVAAVRVQRPVGLVGDLDRAERRARLQDERVVRA